MHDSARSFISTASTIAQVDDGLIWVATDVRPEDLKDTLREPPLRKECALPPGCPACPLGRARGWVGWCIGGGGGVTRMC